MRHTYTTMHLYFQLHFYDHATPKKQKTKKQKKSQTLFLFELNKIFRYMT